MDRSHKNLFRTTVCEETEQNIIECRLEMRERAGTKNDRLTSDYL